MSSLAELFSGDEARAVAALARLTEADGPALLALLAEPAEGPDRRAWAAGGLAVIPGAAVTGALGAATADAELEVRAAAVHALGQRQDPEAVTPLLFALNDASAYIARLAGDALIRLGPAAVPAVAQALDREVDPRVRVNLARALALLQDTRAIPALFRALEDDSAVVQHWAEEGLERLGVGQVYFQP